MYDRDILEIKATLSFIAMAVVMLLAAVFGALCYFGLHYVWNFSKELSGSLAFAAMYLSGLGLIQLKEKGEE